MYSFVNSTKKRTLIRKGYSLLEMLVTLIIVNILILMLSNILIISLRTSVEIRERSAIREELTTILNLMKSDIRNASLIHNDCIEEEGSDICTITKNADTFTWQLCPVEDHMGICKMDVAGERTFEQTSSRLSITSLTFHNISNFINPDSVSKTTLMITITADHSQEGSNIKNIYRQATISTRNFNY